MKTIAMMVVCLALSTGASVAQTKTGRGLAGEACEPICGKEEAESY